MRYDVAHAGIAQLVEHNLAKVGVASSSLVSRSRFWKLYEKLEHWFKLFFMPIIFYLFLKNTNEQI